MRTEQELHDDRRQILDMIQATASELVVELGDRRVDLDAVLALREGRSCCTCRRRWTRP